MPETQPQSYAHHTRWDPMYHFFIAPVLLLTVIGSMVSAYRYPSLRSGWVVVFCIASLLTALKVRTYALQVQDRLIRLEEKLRMASVLSASQRAYIDQLEVKQFVGLRFASDDELAALVERAAKEKLELGDIKKAIVNWRADDFRV